MTYQAFTASAEARQRYWARSHVGWGHVAKTRPNAGHVALAELQRLGLVTGVVTQNVDGLHTAAGSPDVIELHGGLEHVRGLRCGDLSSREGLRTRLAEANPGFDHQDLPRKPDGDVDLDHTASFVVCDCVVCGGVLKPDVVFFGETVPRDRVERAFALLDQAASLLVLGSSLQVMSGYRFVLRAAKAGTPVAIVNQGPTRGDAQATVKVDAPLGAVLTDLAVRSGALQERPAAPV
jgi:NAD-dependent SIR2 family protein deacetylase